MFLNCLDGYIEVFGDELNQIFWVIRYGLNNKILYFRSMFGHLQPLYRFTTILQLFYNQPEFQNSLKTDYERMAQGILECAKTK
jgi:hypothetical protein